MKQLLVGAILILVAWLIIAYALNEGITASTPEAQPMGIPDAQNTAADPTPAVTPESTPSSPDVCSCTGDTYNCNDFSTRTEAQDCYEYCFTQGAGDIHKLDIDGNGKACATSP